MKESEKIEQDSLMRVKFLKYNYFKSYNYDNNNWKIIFKKMDKWNKEIF